MIISDIFTHLIELASNVTDSYSTALYTADAEKKNLVLRDHWTINSNLIPENKIPFGSGLAGKVAETGELCVLDQFESDSSDPGIYKNGKDLKSILSVPVKFNEMVGVLVLATKESFAFPPKHQKIVSSVADQIAWHLYQEKQGQNPPGLSRPLLSRLNDFTRRLAQLSNRKEIGEYLLGIDSSILKSDAAAVVWLDEAGGGKVQHRGFDEILEGSGFNRDEGIVGECVENKIPILKSLDDSKRFTIFQENENTGSVKSIAAVPITHNMRLFGVLVYGSFDSMGLTSADLDNMTMIAGSAGLALSYADVKNWLIHDKNRDPITEIFNHRFLADHQKAISRKIFRKKNPVYFLALGLIELPSIYENQGVERGDQLLRDIVSVIKKSVPSPKNIFKYSDNVFLIMVLNRSGKDFDGIESRLKETLMNHTFNLEDASQSLKFEWGLSRYPDDGENLLELISLSWARIFKNRKENLC